MRQSPVGTGRKKVQVSLGWWAAFAEWIFVGFLLVAAFSVRLYKIDAPLGDWHSFRQSDTASVTREYVQHGVDILRPQYHDVSNIQSGQLNLDGWRMVEFPLLNALTASILQTWPQLDLVVTSRMVSIVSSLVSLACVLFLARKLFGRVTMVIAGVTFAFLPYSIYYSRVILPEPFMVMWSMLAAVGIYLWSSGLSKKTKQLFSKNDIWLVLAALSFMIALLVKPVALFFVPFYIGIFWRFRVWRITPWILATALLTVALVPLWWWRTWIQQFPSGIPASDWLLNGNGIRLKPAWWRWLFADRIGRLMFGYWGAPLLLIGWVAGVQPWKAKKLKNMREWFIAIWKYKDSWFQVEGALIFGAVGMLAYLVVFASGNVQHDYYQIPLVPILVLLWARGASWLIEQGSGWLQKIELSGVVAIIGLFSIAFAWYEVAGWFNINNPAYVTAGAAVQQHTPDDALVIAPGFGDTTFLFQTERRGWPIGFEIEDKIAAGAQYYVSTAYDDEARRLEKQFTVIEKTEEYILIDLQQPILNELNETESVTGV